MQSRYDWLKPTNQQVEGEELSAMRVAGKLEIDSELTRRFGDLRTMREEHAESIARRTCKSGGQIAFVRIASRGVGDAGDDQAVANDAVIVLQKGHAEACELLDPFSGAPVVLMISGDDEDSVASAKIGERRDGMAKIF